MIYELSIKNYKSVLHATTPLTRLTVFIGENGAGKSNILESLVLAAAASANKLDTEYLTARGVRLTEPRLMKSVFDASTKSRPIDIRVKTINPITKEDFANFRFVLEFDNESEVGHWVLDPRSEFPTFGQENEIKKILQANKQKRLDDSSTQDLLAIAKALQQVAKNSDSENEAINRSPKSITVEVGKTAARIFGVFIRKYSFDRFTVYNPNYETLRNHQATPPTSPLGPKGEGLLNALSALQGKEPARFKDIVDSLELFGWYKKIKIPNSERLRGDLELNRISVIDRYIKSRGIELSELSVNEGFFFVLFYMTLVCSSATPLMFAIENIETALNPKLCEVVVKRLYDLAKKYNKQVIITTHSPAVLDGLNLDDPEQSLVVVRRNSEGHTLTQSFKKPEPIKGQFPVRLSEAFLKGHIGALPKGI